MNNTEADLIATALTEDLVKWLVAWLGESEPVGLDTKADIFLVIMERLKKGVDV